MGPPAAPPLCPTQTGVPGAGDPPGQLPGARPKGRESVALSGRASRLRGPGRWPSLGWGQRSWGVCGRGQGLDALREAQGWGPQIREPQCCPARVAARLHRPKTEPESEAWSQASGCLDLSVDAQAWGEPLHPRGGPGARACRSGSTPAQRTQVLARGCALTAPAHADAHSPPVPQLAQGTFPDARLIPPNLGAGPEEGEGVPTSQECLNGRSDGKAVTTGPRGELGDRVRRWAAVSLMREAWEQDPRPRSEKGAGAGPLLGGAGIRVCPARPPHRALRIHRPWPSLPRGPVRVMWSSGAQRQRLSPSWRRPRRNAGCRPLLRDLSSPSAAQGVTRVPTDRALSSVRAPPPQVMSLLQVPAEGGFGFLPSRQVGSLGQTHGEDSRGQARAPPRGVEPV